MVLMDIVMPGMNGFSIMEEIRNKKKQLPIIVLSNLSQEEDKDRISKYKIDKFYEKTKVTITEVVNNITQFLHS